MKMEVVSTFRPKRRSSVVEWCHCVSLGRACTGRVRGRARSGCFWRGLITKSWKLIGCFLWLNAWRQIVTNVCDAVDRWRDACWHTENDKGLSNGYPHSAPFSCPVTKQWYIQMWRRGVDFISDIRAFYCFHARSQKLICTDTYSRRMLLWPISVWVIVWSLIWVIFWFRNFFSNLCND